MNRVPKLRFKEFCGDWEEIKLKQILEFKNGINASKEQYGKGIKFINVLDILNNDFITYDNIIGKVDIDEKLLDKYSVNYGDILFQRSSETREEVGMANVYLDNKIATFGGFVIRGKKIGNYVPTFINKVLKTNLARNEITSKAGGSTRYNVGQDILNEVRIIIPNMQEQEKIADFLSSVDKKISITEEKLDLFKEYKKGIMQKIFNQELRFKDSNGNNYPEWEEKRLGDVFSFKQGYQIPFKEQIKTKEKGYVRYLYISDFFSDKNLLYVKDDGKEKITETDITVANTGNTAGSFYRGKSGILSNNMFNIQNDEKVVTNDFLFQFLGTSLYSNQLKTFFNSSGQPHLGHKNMSMIIINYPVSFEEQQKIVDFLSSIDNKIDNLTSELEDLKEFKKGLLQQMFL